MTASLKKIGLNGIDVNVINGPIARAVMSKILLTEVATTMKVIQDDGSGTIWNAFGVRTAQTAFVYDRCSRMAFKMGDVNSASLPFLRMAVLRAYDGSRCLSCVEDQQCHAAFGPRVCNQVDFAFHACCIRRRRRLIISARRTTTTAAPIITPRPKTSSVVTVFGEVACECQQSLNNVTGVVSCL